MKLRRNTLFAGLLMVLSVLPIVNMASAQQTTPTAVPTEPVTAATAEATEAAGAAPVWSYAGKTGPNYWSQLSSDNALCKSGKAQSPINIIAPTTHELPALQLSYQPSALTLQNDGRSILMNYDLGSTITLDGTTYTLQQVNFHHPAENEINGILYPMEIQLVNAAANGDLAIVSVMVEENAQANTALASIANNLPDQPGDAQTIADVTINANDLLPADREYYSYTGSLTTPPCTEGVKWIVLATPITISSAQLGKFTRPVSPNARPVQPLNSRVVSSGI